MFNPDKNSGFITIFGSANIDIGGMPHYELIERDSNPGQIRISPGGVGRNIAHNLCLLGNKVKLVTALGHDTFADRLRENFNEAGIDADESLVSEQDPTSVYLYITEEDGN
nr:MarR family transcriptional regulator [Lachnospiraceae bacterium]